MRMLKNNTTFVKNNTPSVAGPYFAAAVDLRPASADDDGRLSRGRAARARHRHARLGLPRGAA